MIFAQAHTHTHTDTQHTQHARTLTQKKGKRARHLRLSDYGQIPGLNWPYGTTHSAR